MHNVLWYKYVLLFKKNLAFDFCQFCVVIRFFHPRHNGSL